MRQLHFERHPHGLVLPDSHQEFSLALFPFVPSASAIRLRLSRFLVAWQPASN